MNISKLEARSDWTLIVAAVPCRECQAMAGSLCRDVGTFRRTGVTVHRADWHAERKYDAAFAWYNRENPGSLTEEEQRKSEGKGASGYSEGPET
jgi:hypothetical protein